MVQSLEKLLPGKKEYAIRSLVQTVLRDDGNTVKCQTGRTGVLVGLGQVKVVECRVRSDWGEQIELVYFYSTLEQNWPEWIEMLETVVDVKSFKVSIPCHNTTYRDIFLEKRTDL